MCVYDATIMPQRERNSLTCSNEKVQIKNIKIETVSMGPPARQLAVLAIVTNTNIKILR